MSGFDVYLKALSREGFWGPFLVLAGLGVFYATLQRSMKEPGLSEYAIVGAGAFLALAGVFLMFRQLSSGTKGRRKNNFAVLGLKICCRVRLSTQPAIALQR
jgi:hypothetical protein